MIHSNMTLCRIQIQNFMNPFFSIIIPTYNRCELLKNTLSSIMNQTFRYWECIIINDGSTDNTKNEIENFIKNENRITLVNQENTERAIARNNGAELAKGKYLIFIDSDDLFEISHLESLHNFISEDKENTSMYFTNAIVKTAGKSELIFTKNIPEKLPIDFFLLNSVIPARVCLDPKTFALFKFDPRTIIVEDTILWTEILNEFEVKYIPISSVIYNLHDDNSVNISKNNAYLQRLNGLKILFKHKKVGLRFNKKIQNHHLNRCYYGIIDYYYFKDKKLSAFYFLVKSIVLYPKIDLKYKLSKTLLLLNFTKTP
jgi:glycosyltransferase involved in cell wall biosynthesis